MGRAHSTISSNRRSPRRPTITTLPIVRGPDHLAADTAGDRRTFRSGPTPAPRGRGRARRGPSSVDVARAPRPRPAAAGSRPSRPPRPARPRNGTTAAVGVRAAPTRPTLPCGRPAPSAPVAAAPCGPSRPGLPVGVEQRSPEGALHVGHERSSQPRATCSWAAGHGDREFHGVPTATPGTARQAPRDRPGTTAPARSSDHSSRPPGVRWPQTVTARNDAALVLQIEQPQCPSAACLGVSRGQAADPRNDPHLQAIPAV